MIRSRWLLALLVAVGCTPELTGDDQRASRSVLDPPAAVPDAPGDRDDDGVPDAEDCAPDDARYQRGECAPGTVAEQTCGSDVGACSTGGQQRTCLPSCAWAPWDACTGETAPTAEVCGNAIDDSCDGRTDEGCGCTPTPPGQPGVLWVPGPVVVMRPDPTRCLVYALVRGPVGQLVVIDTATKAEIARVDVGPTAVDLDVAPDGSRIAIALGEGTNGVAVIAPPQWDVVTHVPTAQSDVDAVEITREGLVYYFAHHGIRSVNPATGDDVRLASAVASPLADMELSVDERTLWVGSIGATPGKLMAWLINDDGTLERGQRTDHMLLSGVGFGGRVALSGDGRRAAYAGFVFDTADLTQVQGGMDATMYALDASGTFGVSGQGMFDATLLRGMGEHPTWAWAAALTAGDQEVWWYDSHSDLLHHANVADYMDRAELGQRELAPLPLAAYAFDDLVADPARPWLYAVDAAYGEVVILDRATLTPVHAIVVGTGPRDLALDPSGRYLYVGQKYTWAVARIDLAALRFDAMIWTHQFSEHIAALRDGRVAVLGGATHQDLALIDGRAGRVLARGPANAGYHRAALGASQDGSRLFVGDGWMLNGANLRVYDVASDRLDLVRELPWEQRQEYQYVGMAVVPGADDVLWAGARWRTSDLARTVEVPAVIVTVTPDQRLAISKDRVYAAATGADLGALPAASAVQALSPDGRTLYLGVAGAIRTVDLTRFTP